jgi:hypothetical protein
MKERESVIPAPFERAFHEVMIHTLRTITGTTTR